MYNLSNFAFQEITNPKARKKIYSNPNNWLNRKNVIDRIKSNPNISNSNKEKFLKYQTEMDNSVRNWRNIKRGGLIGAGLGTGYLGYRYFKNRNKQESENPLSKIQIGDETDRKVLYNIGKGIKWAGGATLSGKALDLGRRSLGYHYANWQLKNPNKLNKDQVKSYENIIKSKGALGDIKNTYHAISGVGNIGEKTGNILKTKWGKVGAIGGIGALGAGLYGYNQAKKYYLI